MICYKSQLIWQINLRDAFMDDRQMNPPGFADQGDNIYEDALNLLKK